MSEEEALKTIEELKNYISLEMIDNNKPKELTDLFAKSMVAFQVMKNEYNKEKEKNKFINEVKAIGTDDVVNVVLTKSQYEYLLEKATNGFNKEQEKNKNSISKNKIKEIIKKVDDCSTDMAETVVFWLEELLEE